MSKIMGNKYEMEYIPGKNIFFIKVWGYYSTEDAEAFIKSYNDETKKFSAEKNNLIIDATKLLTSGGDAKSLLTECMKLYMMLPYKNRIFIKSASPTANLMIKNAMKDGGMIDGKDGLLIEDMKAAEEYIKAH